MDDPSSGPWSGGTFRESLGVCLVLDQVAQTKEEVTHIDLGAMKVKEPLQKNSDGDDGAAKQEPHQRTAFSDQIHRKLRIKTGRLRGQPLSQYCPRSK